MAASIHDVCPVDGVGRHTDTVDLAAQSCQRISRTRVRVIYELGPRMRALVVGASGGIGSAFVTLLAADARFSQVTAWSRSAAVVVDDKIFPQRVDLCNEATIEMAARTLGEVDLAIVATGLLHDENINPEKSWRSLEAIAMIRAFEVNTIGPALVAKHVLPLIPRNRRAVFASLTARVGSIGDNQLGGWYSYRASKAALNQLIRSLSIELSATATGNLRRSSPRDRRYALVEALPSGCAKREAVHCRAVRASSP
jgi:NADP-dependent 3-hydroxy acid dehydrogenase YdfG